MLYPEGTRQRSISWAFRMRDPSFQRRLSHRMTRDVRKKGAYRSVSALDAMLLDIVPLDRVAHPRLLWQVDEPLLVHRVADRRQVRRRRLVVHAGGQQPALVVLANVFAGGAEQLEVGEAAHMNLAFDAIGLTDRGQLLDAGDATAQHVDAAHVRGAAPDPVSAGIQAAGGELG